MSQQREVVLSFDDGPHPENTPKLLDALASYGIKAVFFLIGRKLSTPSGKTILKRITSEGHYIGNHTYTHPDLTRLAEAEIRDELARTAALIGDADRGVKIFRPPFGYHNALVDRVARELDYQMVFWNVDTCDWDPKFQPTRWVQHGLNQIRRRQDSFVLMHDVQATTVANFNEFMTAIRAIPDLRLPMERKSIKTDGFCSVSSL